VSNGQASTSRTECEFRHFISVRILFHVPQVFRFIVALIVSVDDASEDVSDILRFLQNNVDPWNLIVEYWSVTSASRKRQLQASTEPGRRVEEYYTEYPALQKQSGYNLVSAKSQ